MQKIKKTAPAVAKLLLFVFLFLTIYNYTDAAFRGSNMHNAIPLVAKQPDESYDVILAGSCHMQLSIQPAQLFAEYGIASCNTGSAAQSIPLSYFLIKEMIDRHSPELVVLDLFTLYEGKPFAADSWAHEALDGLPLTINKARAINELMDEGRKHFYFNYIFYHSRWKELEKADYHLETTVAEKYQFSVDGIAEFPGPFSPVDPEETAEIPELAREYIEKTIKLCKETGTELLLTVTPYRADMTNDSKEASEDIQRLFNSAAKLAEEYGVDYFNCLHHIEDVGLDFMEDYVDASHVNAIGSEKVSRYYGQYLRDNYQLPDRSEDKAFRDWHEDCEEYLKVLEERKANCIAPEEDAAEEAAAGE